MAVRVGHINAHNHENTLRQALRWNTHSLGTDETGKIEPTVINELERITGYTSFHIPGAATPQRSSLSTRVFVRNDLTVTGGVGMLAADKSTPVKIAPNRWLYGVGFVVKGQKYAHVEFHNHAIVDGRTTAVDRVKEHRDGLDVLRATLRYLDALDYATVLTGDLNTRDDAKSVGWEDAGEMFRAMGLQYVDIGLDWVVWNPTRLRNPDLERFTRGEMGTDHPSFVAEFELKG